MPRPTKPERDAAETLVAIHRILHPAEYGKEPEAWNADTLDEINKTVTEAVERLGLGGRPCPT